MDMHHYNMYQDSRMTSRSDSTNESTLRWSHDIRNEAGAQWHQSYEIDGACDYTMRPQVGLTYNLQPAIPQSSVPTYPHMHTNSYNQAGYPEGNMGYSRAAPVPVHGNGGPVDQRFMSSGSMGLQQPMNPPPMGRSMYPSAGYPYNQPPVLRQLHPANEQLCSVPEMQAMRQAARQQHATLPPQRQSPVKSSATNFPPAKALRSGHMGLQNSPFKGAFTSEATNANPPRPAKRPLQGTANSPSASPKKKAVASNISTRQAKSSAPSIKENTSPTSPIKQSIPKPNSRGGATHFITASVVDVLRWKRQNLLNASDRALLVLEVVGTVFDISGTAPTKITIHSQDNLSGVFWETDSRLDRSSLLPGCLARVVLRIPSDGNDFQFLKVTPFAAPPGSENAFRRISYVATTAFEQKFRKP